ncbi:hypothetical protein MA16_Dca012857 [Dendrobium catenatum]|uniref:Uncharacterized protein n=1 Tax=Dendrobium catenatum TaxID=906689 RepID=A0A2I0VXQ6_9ASPA|nr:hypothetical protein MA16_Dca012857 [Dendrobium catenatum]
MDYSSGEESDISDSQIPEQEDKAYSELKSGKYKVKRSNGMYRCPFCLGKKKRDYHYKDLLQHSTGIGSSNRTAKVKANHLALSKYLDKYLTENANPSVESVSQNSSKTEQEELFVWPWMGILVNLLTEFNKDGKPVSVSGTKLKEQLSGFNPLKVHPQWSPMGPTGTAVVDFRKDWTGFKDALAFEKYFEARHLGKKDWNHKKHAAPDMYGWVARADDYESSGKVGEHLRRNGDLKSVSEISREENMKTKKLVANLASEIEVKNKHLHELEFKYNQTTMSLDKMMTDLKEMLHHAHNHSVNVIKENEKLREKLASKREELNFRFEELNNLVALTDTERKKLDDEKKKMLGQLAKNQAVLNIVRSNGGLLLVAKNAMISSSLELATMKQKEADERVSKLIEEHKREKDDSMKRVVELERELAAKQKLELEIEQLSGEIEVMKHMESEEDSIKKRMEEMQAELNEKIEEQQYLECLNSSLTSKHFESNTELQHARKQLIKGLRDILTDRTKIVIRRMGALDAKAFKDICKKKFPKEEADVKATLLCSEWEEHLKNPDWHPFKVITINDKEQERTQPFGIANKTDKTRAINSTLTYSLSSPSVARDPADPARPLARSLPLISMCRT